MSPRRTAGVTGVAVVALFAAVAGLRAVHFPSGVERQTPPQKRATNASSVSGGDAAAVALALSRLTTDPASLDSEAARPTVPDARAAVPVGSTATPHPSSWAPDGVGGGTMLVTLRTGGVVVDYAAVMVHESGGWKVMGTIPVKSGRSVSSASTGSNS